MDSMQIKNFQLMISEEMLKLQKNGSFVNPKLCNHHGIQFHLLSAFRIYTQNIIDSDTDGDSDSDNSCQSIEKEQPKIVDFETATTFKSLKNLSSNTLTQAATLIFQAKVDFKTAKLTKQNTNLNSSTAFFLQQTVEKLMKSLIILNNPSSYKNKLVHTHNLFILAHNVSYDFKSLCFFAANKLEKLGATPNYKYKLLAVRSRYPNHYDEDNNDSFLDCTTLPYLAFKNCDFSCAFEIVKKLLIRTQYYLESSRKSKILCLNINNLVYNFDSLHKILLETTKEEE